MRRLISTSRSTLIRRVYLFLTVAVCGLILASHGTCSADEVSLRYKRWAIVPSKEMAESGLPDLLTARLSQVDGLELVERDQLDLTAKELELDSILVDLSGSDLVFGFHCPMGLTDWNRLVKICAAPSNAGRT